VELLSAPIGAASTPSAAPSASGSASAAPSASPTARVHGAADRDGVPELEERLEEKPYLAGRGTQSPPPRLL